MRFQPNEEYIECGFDIAGFGSVTEILTVEQAKALRDQLDDCIEFVESDT